MRTHAKVSKTMLLLSSLILATACGSNPKTQPPVAGAGSGGGSGSGSGSGWGSGSGSGSGSGAPPYTFAFQISGQGTYTTPAIAGADSIMRVKIYSGTSATVNVPGYEEYNINFGCQDFQVQLNSMAPRQSPILRVASGNDGLCPASQGYYTGATTDFSNELGGGTNTITVSHARYDAYCQIWHQQWQSYWQYYNPSYWNSVYSFMCPMKTVHENHTINGTVCVQVNGQRNCP